MKILYLSVFLRFSIWLTMKAGVIIISKFHK